MKILDVSTVFGFYPYRKLDASLETLREIIGNYNARALALSLKGVFYDAGEGNEETLNLLKTDKNIYPVATYDPRAYPRDIELIKELDSKAFLAVTFFPRVQGWVVDFAPFRLALEAVGDDLPIIVHVGGYGEITKVARLGAEIENPIIISGIGYSNMSEAIAVVQKTENIYIETHLLNSPDALEFLKKYIGTDRIIFGSGTPLLSFETAYQVVAKSSLSDNDKEKIFYKNWEGLKGARV